MACQQGFLVRDFVRGFGFGFGFGFIAMGFTSLRSVDRECYGCSTPGMFSNHPRRVLRFCPFSSWS